MNATPIISTNWWIDVALKLWRNWRSARSFPQSCNLYINGLSTKGKKVEQELVLQFNCCWSDEGRSKSELAVYYWKSLQNSSREKSVIWLKVMTFWLKI